MTIGEICKGIDLLPASRKRTGLQDWLEIEVRAWFAAVLPVTESIAERWGHMAAAARKRGVTLAVVDGIIAATAIEHNLTLVTRNTKDYSGLGVFQFNPWEEFKSATAKSKIQRKVNRTGHARVRREMPLLGGVNCAWFQDPIP